MPPEAAAGDPEPRIRRGTFEVLGGAAFTFGGADLWHLLVTAEGVPVAYLEIPDPGATSDAALSELALGRAAAPVHARDEEVARLTARMGLRAQAPRPSCAVVLCTRRRPQMAARALRALQALDPRPDEIVVVDNDPGPHDCRAIAEAAGARYVLERRRGQNWARAAGLASTSCELVAYTDDDVVVAPGWLQALPRLFADPSVGAATGMTPARMLQTRAQVLREAYAGLVPDTRPLTFDWTNLRPVGSGRAGAGANMVFRRALLRELGDVFPPDLEVGTSAGSGGDLYALYRVLAAGRRIAFDPALYAEHDHPAEPEALRRTVVSYGSGFSAFLAKALVEHRELAGLGTWWWLVGRVNAAAGRAVLGSGREGELQLRLDYLRGGMAGGPGWVRAWRAQRGRRRVAPQARPAPRGVAGGCDGVTVVCAGSAEQRNRDARSATEDVLLFLSPGVEASAQTAASHRARRRAGDHPLIVVGYVEPLAATAGLAAQLTALERYDHHRDRREAPLLTCADLPADNVSIDRELFTRLGGFDASLAAEAAMRELGARALAVGASLAYEPAAAAVQPLRFATVAALADAHRMGADDARLAGRDPALASGPPAGGGRTPALLARRRPMRAGIALADTLEALRLRRSWLRVYRALRAAAYRSARAAGPAAASRARIDVDLGDGGALAPPGWPPPEVVPRIGGVALSAPVTPQRWNRQLAQSVVGALGVDAARALQRVRDPWVARRAPRDLTGTVVVLGPQHAGDAIAEEDLAAAGARIERVGGEAAAHWAAIARCLAGAPEEIAAVPLPGVRADADWLATAIVPLRGARVAAVAGVGVPPGIAPHPTIFVSRELDTAPYWPVGLGVQFLVCRTSAIRRLGGLDASAAAFSPDAPVLDVFQRAIDAGLVVAYQETPGVVPAGSEQPERRRLQWRRAVGRGGLLARAARGAGVRRGALLLAAQLVLRPAATLPRALRSGTPAPRSVLGIAAAESWGCARALVRRRPTRPAPRATESGSAGPRRSRRS